MASHLLLELVFFNSIICKQQVPNAFENSVKRPLYKRAISYFSQENAANQLGCSAALRWISRSPFLILPQLSWKQCYSPDNLPRSLSSIHAAHTRKASHQEAPPVIAAGLAARSLVWRTGERHKPPGQPRELLASLLFPHGSSTFPSSVAQSQDIQHVQQSQGTLYKSHIYRFLLLLLPEESSG